VRAGWAAAAAVLAFSATVVFPAVSGAASGPTFLGPLLSQAETPSITWARDGGISLPLPNGKDFWIFGDTPRFQWYGGAWRMTAFLQGSSAAQRAYSPGKKLDGPLTEVRIGQPTKTTNQPKQFLPSPSLYMPDGSGKACTKKNGGSSVEAVRWATGATLMPDKTNILIPYIEVCVINAATYHPQGWGFTLYNYKTNKFTMQPYDVFKPTPDGAEIAPKQFFRSPIIKNGKVTFYSWQCCVSGQSVYTTTMSATVAALKNPASYSPTAAGDLPGTFNLTVSPPAAGHTKTTMYVLAGNKGEYEIYASAAPTGPWSKVGTGQLPRCADAPSGCNSFGLHPEISPAKHLIVSYYLPGFGPGIATKHPSNQQAHVVIASLPCNC
jgi:hypothetical protein